MTLSDNIDERLDLKSLFSLDKPLFAPIPSPPTASPFATIQVYEGGYHALHQDLPEVAESVLKEVTSWITERLPAVTSQQPQGS